MGERTKYFQYAGLSHFQESPQAVHLFADTARPVSATVTIPKRHVGAIREAFNALMLVLEPGFHYRSSTGKGTINYDTRNPKKAESRNRFFQTIRRTDPEAMVGMDPTVSISAKGITVEGMALNAQDMGTIFIPASTYQVEGDLVTGTSTIEVGPDLMSGLFQITAKKDLVIRISTSADSADEAYIGSVHKDFVRDNHWRREILQFLASSTIPTNPQARFKRIDLYNVLRHLRLNKAEKGESEALRLVLINGLNPEMHIAPWGIKVVSPSGPYQSERSASLDYGNRDKLVRLEPLLPYIEHVDVSLMGEALPGFWTLNSEAVSYTYATMGFSPANWARGVLRDQMLRRDTDKPAHFDAVLGALKSVSCATVDELVNQTGLDMQTVQTALVRGVQQGSVAPNAGVQGYQYRELFVDEAMDLNALRFAGTRENYKDETRAYEIVAQGRVDLEGKIHVKPTGAVDFSRVRKVKMADEVKYTVDPVSVSQAKMSFQTEDPVFYPKLQLNTDGGTAKPGCDCAYKKAMGPNAVCSHLQALWIHYCRDHILGGDNGLQSLAASLLVKVSDGESTGHRISIRGSRVIDEWGTIDDLNGVANKPERRVRLYQRQEDASKAYQSRIAELEGEGFVNAG